jgi:hypothetical protein
MVFSASKYHEGQARRWLTGRSASVQAAEALTLFITKLSQANWAVLEKED